MERRSLCGHPSTSGLQRPSTYQERWWRPSSNAQHRCQKKYKPKGSGLYTELVRQLHSITISSEGDVRQYEKDFRKVNVEIADLDNSLVLPEPHLIQLFLMGLGEVFEDFVTTYTQTHVLYGPRAVKFDEVSYAAVNEELRILSANDGGLAMFAGRSAKGKVRSREIPATVIEEICLPCKTAGRKYRHSTVKCWTKFLHLKPKKFKIDEEKKKKAQIVAINSTTSSSSDAPPNKPKRIDVSLWREASVESRSRFDAEESGIIDGHSSG